MRMHALTVTINAEAYTEKHLESVLRIKQEQQKQQQQNKIIKHV